MRERAYCGIAAYERRFARGEFTKGRKKRGGLVLFIICVQCVLKSAEESGQGGRQRRVSLRTFDNCQKCGSGSQRGSAHGSYRVCKAREEGGA